jgi:hypothetical protein
MDSTESLCRLPWTARMVVLDEGVGVRGVRPRPHPPPPIPIY